MIDWLNLHQNERVVYLYVYKQAGNSTISIPDRETIAEECNINKNEAKKAVEGLKERQLFMATQEKPDLYKVIPLEKYAPMHICSAIYKLSKLKYKDYLSTEHWQEVRRRALEYAGYSCQLCNSKIRLNVHHRTYKNRGNELPTDVVVLCQACHEKFHDIGEAANG